MGAVEGARRFRVLVEEELGGVMVGSPDYTIDFFHRRIELRFWVALPFSSENSWRSEEGGLTRAEYATANAGARDDVTPVPTSEMGTQTEPAHVTMADRTLVDRAVAAIIADRQEMGLPEVSHVEQMAMDRIRLRHEQEAEEARRRTDAEIRRDGRMPDPEGEARGRPVPRMSGMGHDDHGGGGGERRHGGNDVP